MNTNYQHMYEQCKKHMHSYVLAEMVDGTKVDGIITGLDNENVYFAVPIGGANQPYAEHDYRDGYPDERVFGYGYPGYGYGFPGYGYYRPPRRFQRLILPLAALAALSVLPWY
ncbi:hypothetical protein [Virgibacillus sediminis]|uniref:Phosphatidylinositol kinase n=1 Tax=Virgibacillus sediminis TaxID=202260 RepID=A0ABV7AAD9_9BACI